MKYKIVEINLMCETEGNDGPLKKDELIFEPDELGRI
jgi:hypothetical protein